MAVGVDLGFIGLFLPIFAFLLVMIVVYAILQKTKFLGDSPAISLFLSIIMASFFIVEVHLVDFVSYTSGWVSVFVVSLFMLFLIMAFIPGADKTTGLKLLEGKAFSGIVLALMIIFFIFSATYVFNLAINFDSVNSWADSEWFGFLLLVVIGGVVSAILFRGASSS
jgi:hypothetical protein